MSQNKSFLTQNTVNESLHNIVTERAPPLHSHNQFIQKFQRQIEDKKNISFGSLQHRKSQYFSPKKVQKKPGPGEYNLQIPNITKKSFHSKTTPFGITIQRFKNSNIKTIPGPGTYYKENIKKINLNKAKSNGKKFVNQNKFLRLSSQNVQVPGPGSYKVEANSNIEKRRQILKDKILEIKQKREKTINLKTIMSSPKGEKAFASLKKNEQYPSHQKQIKKNRKQIIYHPPTKPLQRTVLKEKTNKYLPEIKFQKVNNVERKGMNFCNYQNSFIEKNDKAFKGHFLKHEMSNPGIYHQEKPILIYEKKSSFFLSESKRKVF